MGSAQQCTKKQGHHKNNKLPSPYQCENSSNNCTSLLSTNNLKMRGGNGTDHNQNYGIIKYPRGFLQKYHEEIAEYTSDNV